MCSPIAPRSSAEGIPTRPELHPPSAIARSPCGLHRPFPATRCTRGATSSPMRNYNLPGMPNTSILDELRRGTIEVWNISNRGFATHGCGKMVVMNAPFSLSSILSHAPRSSTPADHRGRCQVLAATPRPEIQPADLTDMLLTCGPWLVARLGATPGAGRTAADGRVYRACDKPGSNFARAKSGSSRTRTHRERIPPPDSVPSVETMPKK